jgi:hypothetical protein
MRLPETPSQDFEKKLVVSAAAIACLLTDISEITRESGLLPAVQLETLIECGFIKPDMIHLIMDINDAPLRLGHDAQHRPELVDDAAQ